MNAKKVFRVSTVNQSTIHSFLFCSCLFLFFQTLNGRKSSSPLGWGLERDTSRRTRRMKVCGVHLPCPLILDSFSHSDTNPTESSQVLRRGSVTISGGHCSCWWTEKKRPKLLPVCVGGGARAPLRTAARRAHEPELISGIAFSE